MRVLMAVAAVLSASLAMAPHVDASQQKKADRHDYSAPRAQKSPVDYAKHVHAKRAYAKRAREEAHECARAQSLDPAGNYKAYPCWARAALAPKDILGR
jgi:hypothetical protein